MKIYKISGSLDAKGWDKRIQELNVTETAKSFVNEGNRISKDKLLRIDTIFREGHTLLRYYTYCKEGEQQLALDLIKNHIVEKVKKYKHEIDILFEFIQPNL